jgi:hypothetical protein
LNGFLQPADFVRESLELHLFFGRIAKEHSIFLEAGFVSKDSNFAKQADMFKTQFTKFMKEVLPLANGVLSEEVVKSGELITDKTMRSEQISQELSGILIDTSITSEESKIAYGYKVNAAILENQVFVLNQKAIALATSLAEFKKTVYDGMVQCKLFTWSFPLLVDHIRREALFYIKSLQRLQRRQVLDLATDALEQEMFWNRIMKEHAWFIEHLLDPTEFSLIKTAQGFAQQFAQIEQLALPQGKQGLRSLTSESIKATKGIRDFKATGTDQLLACKIKSLILPLLADHTIREANHYLRILRRSKHELQI